jgi:hypothetical protein
MDILGIPYLAWGVVGLALAVLWIFVWPQKNDVLKNSPQYFILRWFHTLVWLFLSAAGFLSYFNVLGGRYTAQLMSLLALITYLIFMATVTTTK